MLLNATTLLPKSSSMFWFRYLQFRIHSTYNLKSVFKQHVWWWGQGRSSVPGVRHHCGGWAQLLHRLYRQALSVGSYLSFLSLDYIPWRKLLRLFSLNTIKTKQKQSLLYVWAFKASHGSQKHFFSYRDQFGEFLPLSLVSKINTTLTSYLPLEMVFPLVFAHNLRNIVCLCREKNHFHHAE